MHVQPKPVLDVQPNSAVAQRIECYPVKVDVAGSTPVSTAIVQPSATQTKEARLAKARAVLVEAVQPKTDALQSKSSGIKTESNSRLPLYNPKTSKPGDLVRKWIGGRYVEVVVKEVDGEGNEIPEYY